MKESRAILVFGISIAMFCGGCSDEPDSARPHGRMEEMAPDELEEVLAKAPVAYVPLGTYEHHGWHLPIGCDGLSAHALCERAAQRTGGVVLPTFYYSTGGGHVGYKWTLILPEQQIAPIIEATLEYLARHGFKVIVILTGHYPVEQVKMVQRLAQEAQQRNPRSLFLGYSNEELTTPQPGDISRGDHAAKYETSIALAVCPDLVQMDSLTAGRDPNQVVLPQSPGGDGPGADPTHPLYAIYGQDPRVSASAAVGENIVEKLVSRLVGKVEHALSWQGANQ